MVKPKILFNINIILKTIIIIVLLISGSFFGFFDDVFESKYLYTIGIMTTEVIFGIILIIGCFFWYFIIFCEKTKEFQKIKQYYKINLISEIIVVFLFTNEPFSMLAGGYSWAFIFWLCILIISIITSIIGLKYFYSRKLEFQGIQHKPEILEKLRDILNVSNKIKLERVQNVLNLDDKSFDEKIIEWAKAFNFRIDGEYLIVNKESISEFIEALDNKFVEWEEMEKDKIDKL